MRIKRVAFLCVVYLIFAPRSLAYGKNMSWGVKQQKQTVSLKLTMTVIEKQYCKADSELDGLRMKLKLTFTNTGSQQIILYKGSNSVSRLIVTRNLRDSSANKIEVNATLTQITAGKGINLKTHIPNQAFVILPPGGSYEVEATVTVFAVRNDMREITGAVASGEHALQIEVSTWPFSKSFAHKLRNRWQKSGTLWYEPITSIQMPFTIEKQRQVVDCP